MITPKIIKNCADGFERLEANELDETTLTKIQKSSTAKFVVIDEKDNVRVEADGAMLLNEPVNADGVISFLGWYEDKYVFLQSVKSFQSDQQY